MPAARRNALTERFFRLHPWIYRKTGGRVLGSLGDTPVLLLNTIGRRSRLPRTNGLAYVERPDGWLVTASWAGEPKHPIWYLNLMADREVTIQVKDQVIPVRARDLEGEERDLAWKEIVTQDPSFAEYEERTRGVRKIPVVLLERRDPSEGPLTYTMYGLGCSYFTGKLEAYFNTKGLPYRSVEMTRTQMRRCAKATGIAQLPCIEASDGTWMTDTTPIMEHFESQADGPRIRPTDAATAFCSLLFEDLFDEWFWRPALYYRWRFKEDATLMGRVLGRTIFSEMRAPLALRQRFAIHRQRTVYLRKDGVTEETSPSIEKLYMGSLRALDGIFAKRPFLFGDRPCEADYGLFGPFFRHFFCDPTPGALMRTHAPHLTNWVTRLWAMRPKDLEGTQVADAIPDDLGFFFDMVAHEYLPYLEANSVAVEVGEAMVRYEAQGVRWEVPAAPYRARCLNELKKRFNALDPTAASQVAAHLPASGLEILRQAPIVLREPARRVGRLGRPAQMFD